MKLQQYCRRLVVTYVVTTMTIMHASSADVTVLPLPGRVGGQSSPVVAELDGNASNGLETVVSTIDGLVTVVRSDGSEVWSQATPDSTCPFTSSNDRLYSSPVVGALFGDGVPYVVVGYGGYKGKACDGGVIAYRGGDGAVAWTFSIKKWARKRGYDAFRNAVVSTPALADVDGTGKLVVGFGSFDRNVYLLNSNGSVRWYYNAADTVFSSPTFVDIDGDGTKEMVIGTDISQNLKLSPPTPNGGFLYAFRTKKVTGNGLRYVFRDVKLQAWRTEFDQVVQSSPVSAELVSSNPGPEIVVGTGCFFPQSGADRRGKYFKVVSAKTGKVLRTLNVTACTPSSPAVADLDGDGVAEVVVTVSGSGSAGGDGKSHLIAWNPEADAVLWDISPKLGDRTDNLGGHFNRSPVVADLSGDGRPEVVVSYSNGVVVADGQTGAQLTCDETPCTKPLLKTESQVTGRPIVQDTDGDSVPEILVAGRDGSSNALYRWEELF